MCQHRSYIVLETGTVLSLIDNDSHSTIAEKHHLRDTALNQSRHCSIELIPDRLDDCSGWKLVFDDTKPDWWSEQHEKEVRRQLAWDHAAFCKDGEYKFGGYLNLSSLTSLPANAKLCAGGYLNLSSLTSLPANAKLSAGGNLDLRSLTSLPANAKLSAGGNLDLRSLTSLPANAKLSAGGDLYLRGELKAEWLKRQAKEAA